MITSIVTFHRLVWIRCCLSYQQDTHLNLFKLWVILLKRILIEGLLWCRCKRCFKTFGVQNRPTISSRVSRINQLVRKRYRLSVVSNTKNSRKLHWIRKVSILQGQLIMNRNKKCQLEGHQRQSRDKQLFQTNFLLLSYKSQDKMKGYF